MITIDISQIENTWCVYSHTVVYDEGPKIMYVGFCKLRDVLKSPDARKNTEWRKRISSEKAVKLDILHVVETEAEAFNKSLGLINTHKPYCNAFGSVETTLNAVECITDGRVFSSASEAARFYTIAKSTMSNHLNGREGYSHIRGMTFKRI